MIKRETNNGGNDIQYVLDNLCKIIFYSGWGDNESYEQCCAINTKTYLMPERFSEKRPGYRFLGWGLAINDDVVYVDQDQFTPTDCPTALYGQWKENSKEVETTTVTEEGSCIVGYDPLPVIFRDMSDVRSFSTKYWRWDFGDSIVYGCDTRNPSIDPFSDEDSEYSRFELPSDETVHQVGSASQFGGVHYWRDNVEYFRGKVQKCLMGIDYDENWKSYHFNDPIKHFTGMNFCSSSADTSGSGFIDAVAYGSVGGLVQHRFRRYPSDDFESYTEVAGIDIPADQCARVSCEQEYDFGNSIAHIYKGPGIYYATMVCSSENQSPKSEGLQGMDLDDSVFDSTVTAAEKERIKGCWVNVLPVCPCVSGFKVYGTEANNTRFRTVTADDFCCDSTSLNSALGDVEWNCYVTFKDFNGEERTTPCVSGYAPYMKVAASGVLVARSLPVTGAWMDWSDWNTDYMKKDHTEFGEVVRGWPTWATKALDESGEVIASASEVSAHNVSGDHIYTLPGLYSVGISPEFDRERIRRYMPTVLDYDYCSESTLKNSASGCCVLVVEIPPTFNKIFCYEPTQRTSHETTVLGISADVSAGSYPISRIDWDFGDGSEILTISTEGFRVNNKDVINNVGYPYVDYNSDRNVVTRIEPDQYHTTTGYMNGNPLDGKTYDRYPYQRLDARNYTIDHTYVRTSVDDGATGYVIKCSAYAENTNTCVTYERAVLTAGGGLPNFDSVEGYVEMVDIRSDSSKETNVVLQSAKEDRIYINRSVDTGDEYNYKPDIIKTPDIEPPTGGKPNTEYYCFVAQAGEEIDGEVVESDYWNQFSACIPIKTLVVPNMNLIVNKKVYCWTPNGKDGKEFWEGSFIVEIYAEPMVYEGEMTTAGNKWQIDIPVTLKYFPVKKITDVDEIKVNSISKDFDLYGKWKKSNPFVRITGEVNPGDEVAQVATVDLFVAADYNDPVDDGHDGHVSIMTRHCKFIII